MADISKVKINSSEYNIKDATALHTTDKGAANGVAPLNASKKIDSTYLPSYVDDVIEGYYHNSKFYEDSTYTKEITGETGKIYVDKLTEKIYRYSGSAYVEISPHVGTAWGSITGTLSNQEDLQEALDIKEDVGKITISNTEYTLAKHTLSWTNNGTSYSYQVVTVS